MREKVLAVEGVSEPLGEFEIARRMREVKIFVVKTARIAGFPAPTLEKQDNFCNVLVPDTGFRIYQKAVYATKFSHRQNVFQDSIIVEGAASSASTESTAGGHRGETGKISVWFANFLAFVRLRASRGPLSDKANEDFAVVRYYETIPGEQLDAIDRATECVKLRWAVDEAPGEGTLLQSEPATGSSMDVSRRVPEVWIDVVPVTSIRGRVHAILAPLGPSANKYAGDHDWTQDRFYVNQFKLRNNEPTYNVNDVYGD